MYWAEKGIDVWVITSENITENPRQWIEAPDKNILKQMTFMYVGHFTFSWFESTSLPNNI